MQDSIRVEMEMEQKMCSKCKKSSSEYYELELQLRFKYFKETDSLKAKVLKLLDEFDTINKLDEVENGFNVRFISKGEMNKISSLFVKRFFVLEKRASKLVGRDNLKSKDLYRHTQSITLLDLGVGDLVSIKGEEYNIKAINKGNVLVLLDSKTGAKKVISYSIIKDYFKLLEKK